MSTNHEILQSLLAEANRNENISIGAKSVYEQLVARSKEDGLSFHIPLDEIDDKTEDCLRALKKEGFLDKELRYTPQDGHYFEINLESSRFHGQQNNPTPMLDSGKREVFYTGSVRDSQDGKMRPDLVSPFAMESLGLWLAEGAEKYGEGNWRLGQPFSRVLASLYRHLIRYQQGDRTENHLCGIAVNAIFLLHYSRMIELGRLPESLDDLPNHVVPSKRSEIPNVHRNGDTAYEEGEDRES